MNLNILILQRNSIAAFLLQVGSDFLKTNKISSLRQTAAVFMVVNYLSLKHHQASIFLLVLMFIGTILRFLSVENCCVVVAERLEDKSRIEA